MNKDKKAVFLFDYTGIMARPWADAGYLCYCFDGQHPLGVSKSEHPNILNVGMWFSDEITGDISGLDIDKIKSITGDDVSFLFGFPECTQLAVSGAAHFASKRDANPFFQDEAMALVKLVKALGDSYGCSWALENPISVISTMWRKPDFKFNPHEYGGYLPEDDVHPEYPEYIKPRDAYPKKTCIWSGNGFVEPEIKPVGPDGQNLVNGLLPKHKIPSPFYRVSIVNEVDSHGNETGKTIKISIPANPNYKENGTPVWGYSDQHNKLGGKSLKTKNIRSATPRGFAIAVFLSNGKEL